MHVNCIYVWVQFLRTKYYFRKILKEGKTNIELSSS